MITAKTWRITASIPVHDFTRVIREDPARRGLLYAGTETGVYASSDDGGSWQPLQLNLPAVPVYDLVIKDNDLVAATHGRSFWILDDLTPLHRARNQVLCTSPSVRQARRSGWRHRWVMLVSRVWEELHGGPGHQRPTADNPSQARQCGPSSTPEKIPRRCHRDVLSEAKARGAKWS
jgi:hypothetical protein